MKISALIIVLLLLVPALLQAHPAIEFAEQKHAFGPVGQETKPEHFFDFVNRGDQDLVIEKVSAS